ncbi:hypothetical protein [Phycicoccus sp. SLBN-51]|jgi:hypothetical protein|uniref:hypothetical protein n=1 Tax=Phycicoccus sp. SLBN-51 TaxID=2768447 RepID=UPI001154BB6C|nr:hypothetical protein [Phycicoccus sp. SLBN-51]TQJ52244.1 hypothetical protein FBY26_3994 [Phycicoccus sp. SLBN-51]
MSLIVLFVLIGTPLLLTLTALSLARVRVATGEEWKWVRLMWAAAVLIGGVVAWLLQRGLDLGRGSMLAPAILGVSVVAGVGLGETVVRPRRPAGPRTASLVTRHVTDYLPRGLTAVVVAIAAVHLVTLALTTATASADDMGRAGRQVAAQCGDTGSAASPYPGSFYSGPLTVLLVVVGIATLAALMAVVRRPRGLAPDEVGDDVLRRWSTTRVLAAAGAALAASHAGIAFFAGTALLRMDCQRAWMELVGWALVASVPVALLLLGWLLGRILTPGALPVVRPEKSVEAR